EDHIPKIFDRFYQVDGSHIRDQNGTGIGLSLAKELVELHKGNIEVYSEIGKGTSFTISLPLGREHLKPEEIFESVDDKEDQSSISSKIASQEEVEIINSEFDFLSENGNPLLLLVEDNFDIRNYIKEQLNNDFKIVEAVDGEDGWNKSLEHIPELIVSDVMMPKMDGFELCSKLKNDERTSHIPLILLTAKAESSDKIEGYEAGADDYIMKPFEPDELIARIKNLIVQRKRLHDHFKAHGIIEIEGKNITSLDKKFLKNAVSIINENISDSAFSVAVFAEMMFISQSLLFKKLNSLTGLSPVEFIRTTRLKKAAGLIEKQYGNISEVALEVGFSNPSYFAECFKKQFGVTPLQYSKQNSH
ncbi:MAG: response regulator, partial [Melioribacteraceae bacterium]|nr:response regulator [Melioribacteraceae bacterium]